MPDLSPSIIAVAARVTALEDKYVRALWFEQINSGASGTITPPAGGTIVLDQWAAGIDAVTSTITTGTKPDFVSAKNAAGAIITATMDASGNWTISDTPSAYPIAIIYVYEVKLEDFNRTYALVEEEVSQATGPLSTPTFADLTLTGLTASLPIFSNASKKLETKSAADAFTAIKQSASESATGVVQLATTAEATTGTDTAKAVTSSGVAAASVGDQKKHGFINRTNTFTWTNTSPDRTIKLNGVVQYYFQGILKSITDPTVQLGTSTSGLWAVYFNAAGVLTADQAGLPDPEITVIMAFVWWNATASIGCVLDERHSYLRDRKWHLWAHSSIGCRYGSGITLTATGTGAAASFAVSLAGDIWDEDIQFVVPVSSAWTVAHSARIFYQIPTGVYSFANSTNPFLWNGGTSRVRYPNSSHATPYTLADMDSGKYINIWAYACNDINQPIHLIVESLAGTAGYNNASAARQAAPPNLTGMGLAPEMKLIKRIVVRGDGEVQTAITADDYRSSSPLPAGGTTTISAAAVTFAPSGTISATSVQGAIEELDAEAITLSTDAQAVAGTSTTVAITPANLRAVVPDDAADQTLSGVPVILSVKDKDGNLYKWKGYPTGA